MIEDLLEIAEIALNAAITQALGDELTQNYIRDAVHDAVYYIATGKE